MNNFRFPVVAVLAGVLMVGGMACPAQVVPNPGTVAWSSYLGGVNFEDGRAVAVDRSGNIYVVGTTGSDGWVSGGPVTVLPGITEQFVPYVAFLVKLSPRGEHLWSTYVGGTGSETGLAVAVGPEGNVVVGGNTSSENWIAGGWITEHPGVSEALDYTPSTGFVAVYSPEGTPLWSSYVGGTGGNGDSVTGLAVDVAGSIYAVGTTGAEGWVSGGWNTTFSAGDGYAATMPFLVKLDNGGQHVWSTYIGGTPAPDYWPNAVNPGAVAVDPVGNVLVGGVTGAPDWVSGGWLTTLPAEEGSVQSAGFVVKLNDQGQHLWSTYVGGVQADEVTGLATDADGNVFAAGTTYSPGWVSGGWNSDLTTEMGYFSDAVGFVVKLGADGAHQWSTYLGDGVSIADWLSERRTGVAVDRTGSVLVTGATPSGGWVSGGADTTLAGGYDAYLVKLTGTGAHVWSAVFGGEMNENSMAVAVNRSGDAIITGDTRSPDWVADGWNTTLSDSDYDTVDGFVLMLKGLLPLATVENLVEGMALVGEGNPDANPDINTDGTLDAADVQSRVRIDGAE